MRILSERDVMALIERERLIAAAAAAFRALSTGRANVPLRTEFIREDVGGVVFVMPGLIGDELLGLKLIANRRRSDDGMTTTALVLLLDAQSLDVRGLVAADVLTDYRTAAGLAAAVDALAPAERRTHALYGAGKLALPSALLIQTVRPARELLLVGRNPERTQRLADALRREAAFAEVEIRTDVGADEAAARADLVTCVTSAERPVFDGRRLRPGTHVTIGGAFHAGAREIDDAVAGRARFFTDVMSACLERAGDLVQPLASGVLDRARVEAEIGAVLAGDVPFRRAPDDVTVFKSLGAAAQDLVTADRLLLDAERAGRGVVVDLDDR